MLLGFIIMTAFIPTVVGAVLPTAWIVMWFVGPVLLIIQWWRKIKIELTYIHWLGILFLSYATLSLIWSPHGAYELMQLLALASIFVWATTLKSIKNIVIGLAIGLSVSAGIAMLQYLGYDLGIFKITGKPSGLFVNSNIFAETSGMIFVLLLIHKLRWLIPVTIPGLLVSSRAVILGLGVTFLVWAWRESKLFAVGCLIVAGLIVSEIGDFNTIFQRLNMWQDAIGGLTLFGHGVGSFAFTFPIYNHHLDTTVNFIEYLHNDILQLLFEYGIGALFLIFAVMLLLKVDNDNKYAIIFFITIGLFGFPLHMPVTAFMVSIVAGQLANRSLVSSKFRINFRPTISDWIKEQERGFA